jgi:hypothetical protein
MRMPEQRFAVAILANLGSFSTRDMAVRVAEIYLEDALTEQEEEEPSVEARTAVAVDSDLLASYEGTYQINPWRVLTVKKGDDGLTIQENNRPPTPMMALSDTLFIIETTETEVVFRRDAPETEVRLVYGGQKAERVQPFTPDAEALDAYVGDYSSEELGTTYSVQLKEDRLLITHRKHTDGVLTPTVADHFICDLWWMRNIAFLRDAYGRIIGMRVSNGRVRDLHFEKVMRLKQQIIE